MALFNDGSTSVYQFKSIAEYFIGQDGKVYNSAKKVLIDTTNAIAIHFRYGVFAVCSDGRVRYGSNDQTKIVPNITNAKEIAPIDNSALMAILTTDGKIYKFNPNKFPTPVLEYNGGDITHIVSACEFGIFALKGKSLYVSYSTTSASEFTKITDNVDYISGTETGYSFIHKGSTVYALESGAKLTDFSKAVQLNGLNGCPSSILRAITFDNAPASPAFSSFVLGFDNKLYYNRYSTSVGISSSKYPFTLFDKTKNYRFNYISHSDDDVQSAILIDTDKNVWRLVYYSNTNGVINEQIIDLRTRFGFVENKGFIVNPDPTTVTFVSNSETNSRTFYIKIDYPYITSGNVVNYVSSYIIINDFTYIRILHSIYYIPIFSLLSYISNLITLLLL